MSTAGAGRFAPRDRVWLGINNVQLVSLPAELDAAAVTARVDALAQAEPGLRFFTRTVPGHPERYVDSVTPQQAQQAAGGLVSTLPGDDIHAIADSAAKVLDADDGVPAPAVFAGKGIVGHRFPHVFGDGLSAITHLRRLATGPEPGSTRHPWPVPGVDRPLALALRERYRATPRQLLDDLRMDRPSVTDHPASHPGRTPGDTDPATAPQHVSIVFRHLDGPFMGQLKAWRKVSAPGVSTMSIVAAMIRRSLAQQDLIPAPDGMYMAYDLRSYLPKGAGASGNFISVTYIAPDDPLSPASVNATVKQTMDSRRPLLGLAMGAARLAGRRGRIPALPAASTSRDVAFSHMRLGGLLPPDLLAAPGDPAVILAAAKPTSIGSLSFTLGEIADQMSVTAVFCAPFTPRDRVAATLDDVLKDPIGLLDRSSPSPA